MMVRMYKPGDAQLVKRKSVYDEDKGIIERVESDEVRENSIMVTYVIDNEPVAVIAWTLLKTGDMEHWGITSEAINRNSLFFAKSVKALSKKVMAQVKPNRNFLMVYGHDRSKTSHRFAEFLGFTRKEFLRKMKPTGLDYYLYERGND